MTVLSGDSPITIIRNLAELRQQVKNWRDQGLTIGFVPTMGALHDGHLSLVRIAGEKTDRVIASIFVNPTQFAAHEDLGSYPRHEAEDVAMLAGAGCHLVWMPDIQTMYPEDYATSVKVDGVSEGLDGASRPHFFGGVATVVCKLLNQVQPTLAVFGEKDFQQLLVIRRMVEDLNIDVEIIGGPLIREADGLAMSSRNAYLSQQERRIAGQFNLVLKDTATAILAGENIAAALAKGRDTLLKVAGVDKVDYLELRSEADLSPVTSLPKHTPYQARLFGAVVIGKTRLIDNWSI